MSLLFVLTAILYGTCLVGFTGNVIIVAAIFIKWKSQKSLSSCDKILSSLAISRALCFTNIFLRNSIFKYLPWLLQNNIALATFQIQTMFIFCSSNWIATVLCVFYCVKIVTYNYKLFMFLRTRISIMVPRLIQVSILISLISSLPYGWYAYGLKIQSSLNGSTGNMTEYGVVLTPNVNNRLLIFSLGSFPPFIIFCAATCLLIHFLLIHTRRIRSNESHIQSPNLTSHFGAVKNMSLFLLLQILYFICLNVFTSGRIFNQQYKSLIGWIILCSPLLFHSLYMISSSSEVKKMFTSICPSLIRRS